jgi:hypothetical protein
MHTATKRRTAIALLVAVALAVPTSASAATAGQLLPSSAATADTAGPDSPTLSPTPTGEAGSTGFDWEDAGLGAAGMLSLIVLGAGAVGIGRRARRPAPTG